MRRKKSGKVITIFTIIAAILLLSLTALSVYYYKSESEKRKTVELVLKSTQQSEADLMDEVRVLKRENYLLVEKNKEAETRVNDLTNELELEGGIRDEMKAEVSALKERIQELTMAKDQLKKRFDEELTISEERISDLEEKIKKEKEKLIQWQDKYDELEANYREFKEKSDMTPEEIEQLPPKAVEPRVFVVEPKDQIDLKKIVVAPQDMVEGAVMTVDAEADFVIVDLGEKDGVAIGTIFAVYRDDRYLGDLKVTRIQPDMSAADFIPPFKHQLTQKGDTVIIKHQ